MLKGHAEDSFSTAVEDRLLGLIFKMGAVLRVRTPAKTMVLCDRLYISDLSLTLQ